MHELASPTRACNEDHCKREVPRVNVSSSLSDERQNAADLPGDLVMAVHTKHISSKYLRAHLRLASLTTAVCSVFSEADTLPISSRALPMAGAVSRSCMMPANTFFCAARAWAAPTGIMTDSSQASKLSIPAPYFLVYDDLRDTNLYHK
jgi:hypothetical protein